AALAVPAALLMATGGPGGTFFLCALLIAAVNRFFLAGMSASLPHTVPDPLMVTSNAVSSTLGTVAYSLGLGASSLALHTLVRPNDSGYAWLCLAGAAGYLVAALLARAWFEPDSLGPDEHAVAARSPVEEIVVIARGMVAGLRHLVDRRPIAYAYALQGANRTLYGVLTLSTLLLYSRYFYSSYSAALTGLGQIVVVGSLGAVAAAFITPYASRRIGARGWIILLTALIAVILPPLGLPYVPALLVAATFLANLSSQGIKIVVDTAVQTQCAESFRGRIFSIGDMMFNVFFVIGLFIGAFTLPDNGRAPAAVVAVSVGYALVAASFAWLTRDKPALPAVDDIPAEATA
ncbi:MAG TPA: hypothetical protein VKB69_16885, partial [Micromonosporaceae bacterium]|nr:hypothetical protein [Micromonosporaceae bacterium]